MKSLSLVIPLLFIVACASGPSPVGRVEARGDLYTTRQSPDLARAEYLAALKDDPDNPRLQQKLKENEDALIAHRTSQIRREIKEGAPISAAYVLRKARRELGPEHPSLPPLEEEVTFGLQSALHTAEKNAQFALATKLHAAMLAYVPRTSRASKIDQAQYRSAWIAQLKSRALADQEQGLWASSALYLLKMHDLSGDAKDLDQARAMRDRALDSHRYTIALSSDPSDTIDHRAMLPYLEDTLTPQGVTVLTEGSAASGSTFMVELRDLTCDVRQEDRSPGGVASKRPMLIQRCITSFFARVVPSDGNRETLEAEELLTEELVHDTGELDDAARARYASQLTETFHERGAVTLSTLLIKDFEASRQQILTRARRLPLERAVIDAHIIRFWLDPTPRAGQQDALSEVERVSGIENVAELLLALL